MTITYECKVSYADYEDGLEMDRVDAAITRLEKHGYDVYKFNGGFKVCGETYSSLDGDSPRDIADDIQWTLWKFGDIDADVKVDAEYSEEEERQFSPYTLHLLP